MKTLQSLFFSVCALITFAGSLKAANIECETRVPGRGWVRVIPGLDTQIGGKVVNLPRYGGWVTGRVAPSEQFRWVVTASARSEKRLKSAAGLASQMPYVEAAFSRMPAGRIPAQGGTTVPQARYIPAGDGFLVVALTEAGRFAVKLPIGKR